MSKRGAPNVKDWQRRTLKALSIIIAAVTILVVTPVFILLALWLISKIGS